MMTCPPPDPFAAIIIHAPVMRNAFEVNHHIASFLCLSQESIPLPYRHKNVIEFFGKHEEWIPVTSTGMTIIEKLPRSIWPFTHKPSPQENNSDV